jgi:hypothetical protein
MTVVPGQPRKKVSEAPSQAIKVGYEDMPLPSQLHGECKQGTMFQAGPGINGRPC